MNSNPGTRRFKCTGASGKQCSDYPSEHIPRSGGCKARRPTPAYANNSMRIGYKGVVSFQNHDRLCPAGKGQHGFQPLGVNLFTRDPQQRRHLPGMWRQHQRRGDIGEVQTKVSYRAKSVSVHNCGTSRVDEQLGHQAVGSLCATDSRSNNKRSIRPKFPDDHLC